MAPRNSVILVIEDVLSTTQFISAVLAADPFQIVTATDGRKGQQLVAELLPDLILLDLALPEVDGFDVLDSIRANPATAATPVVIITAHGDSSTAAEARDRGADAFISKPFRPAELRRAISRFLPPTTAAAS
jgi:CheY-like chemotaxis protein